MTHPWMRPDQLTPDEMDRLPSVDVSGTDRVYIGPDPDDPDGWVTVVRADADALNKAFVGYSPEDWRDAARLLDRLRAAIEVLRGLDSTLVQWLYLHGEHGLHLQVEGIAGDVAITRGRAKERWEGEPAVIDYVDQRMIELEGEMPDPHVVARWVLEVVPASKLRVTPLRDVGLDVEDYRTSEPGNLQVSLPRRDPTSS